MSTCKKHSEQLKVDNGCVYCKLSSQNKIIDILTELLLDQPKVTYYKKRLKELERLGFSWEVN